MEFTEEEFEVFSTVQITVMIQKAQGLTYEKILKECPNIKSPKVLTNIFRWCLFGRKFNIGTTTGRPPLTGDVQMKIFEKQIHERCDANNSITIFEGITLLEEIHADYIYKNYKIAQRIGMLKLAFELINSIQFQIERSWFIQILKRNGISIRTPEKVEALRNRFCHSNILINFYSNFVSKISQNSNTIFNAD